jgi:hypothetical protein
MIIIIIIVRSASYIVYNYHKINTIKYSNAPI